MPYPTDAQQRAMDTSVDVDDNEIEGLEQNSSSLTSSSLSFSSTDIPAFIDGEDSGHTSTP